MQCVRGVVFTGDALTTELNWYQALATYYIGNPRVWLGSNNEPSTNPSLAALSTWQGQTYDAIRGTGNGNMIMIDVAGVNDSGPGFGETASVYAAMTNIVWDFHYYGWVSGYSTDQSTVNAALFGSVGSGGGIEAVQAMPADGGTAPLVLGEYGDSTDGSSVDANWSQVVQAVVSSGYGSTAWAYPGGGGSADILYQNGALTPYGQRVAGYIATGATGQ